MQYVLAVLFLTLTLGTNAWAQLFVSPESVPAAQKFTKKTLTSGLHHPWGMTWLPDGTLLITERSGEVRRFTNGTLQKQPVPGAPKALSIGQGGLLDIAAHPEFSRNRLVYFTLSTGSRDANRTTLARAVFTGKTFSNVETLFKVSQTKSGGQHFGSRLVWLPDGTLLMSIGDGGNPPSRVDGVLSRLLAQSPQSHLGKVLRLNADGTPANNTPAPQGENPLPELFSTGHRNIQGFAYDPIRNTIWATEHGALGGDELNNIAAGSNYGWPSATFSKEYLTGWDISEHTTLPDMTDPELVWMSAIAPSGLAVYTGDIYAGWKGDLFAGGLRDQSVRRIRLDTSGTVIGEEIIRIGQRVRDVRQGPDGYLYILTDESDGKLIRLEPSETTDPNP